MRQRALFESSRRWNHSPDFSSWLIRLLQVFQWGDLMEEQLRANRLTSGQLLFVFIWVGLFAYMAVVALLH
jgi:hypothetical protein